MKNTIKTVLGAILLLGLSNQAMAALENGTYQCQTPPYEYEDGEIEAASSFQIKVSDTAIISYDEENKLESIYPIGQGWVNLEEGYDRSVVKVTRTVNQVVLEISEAPYDYDLEEPIDKDSYYHSKTTISAGGDGSLVIITFGHSHQDSEESFSGVSTCSKSK